MSEKISYPIMPPDLVWRNVDEAREVVGTGSVYLDTMGSNEPRIHRPRRHGT